MSAEYLSHFSLTHDPFSKEIGDDKLWLAPSKKALVDEICAAVPMRKPMLIVGEPGVGKTCVMRAVRHRLSQTNVRLTYCHNATLGRRDFYRQLCLAMGLSARATAAALFYAVSAHVEELARDRQHPVLLLDEAQLLHQDTLDHLHILLNYEWDSQALLTIVLVGLPELEDRLQLRRNRSLYSRLHRRFRIEALTPEDSAEYIRMRLESAGGKAELMTRDVVSMLHETSIGTMRELDRLASDCLRVAAAHNRSRVERDILNHTLNGDSLHARAPLSSP